jgi:hypothetical protein
MRLTLTIAQRIDDAAAVFDRGVVGALADATPHHRALAVGAGVNSRTIRLPSAKVMIDFSLIG